MDHDDGLVGAYVLDGEGGAQKVDWEGVRRWQPTDGFLWVHLDHGEERARRWIETAAGLDPIVAEALLEEETRPRSSQVNEGLLVNLRGVNLNPGADPEDMVALRLWIEETRVVSVRRRPVAAIRDLRDQLEKGRGPRTSGDVLTGLADAMVDRMSGVIADLEDAVGELEEEILTAERQELRARIGAVRRMAITLRRYLAPQRDMMSRLWGERVAWLDDRDRMQLREVSDRLVRYVEVLDAVREHATVMHEELTSRLAEQMNRTMYVLSIVATMFLPLTILTGLLGINVGGIPGSDNPYAFAIVCVLCIVIAWTIHAVFRRKRWL
ncbi:MAG: zinc transporter ZntB [Planctomycetota bacterium]